MYTYDVQYPEFEWDQVRKMGSVDVTAAIQAFRNFPFDELFYKATSLGPDATAATITFRAPTDQPILSIWLMHPGAYEVYMEYVDDKVSIETTDREFVVEAIRTFFSGKHQELYERLAKEPFAVESLGFWKRLKRIFS